MDYGMYGSGREQDVQCFPSSIGSFCAVRLIRKHRNESLQLRHHVGVTKSNDRVAKVIYYFNKKVMIPVSPFSGHFFECDPSGGGTTDYLSIFITRQ
jgi:hypothetical protein